MKQHLVFNTKNIFCSKFSLEYLDPLFEKSYQTYSNQTKGENTNFLIKLLVMISLVFSLFTLTLAARSSSKNITWNGVYSLSNFFLNLTTYFLNKNNLFKNEGHSLFLRNLMINIGFENIFISLISITLIHFQLGMEVVTFVVLLHMFTRSIVSITVHQSFIFTLSKILIIFSLKIILLTRIHFIWDKIFYLVLDFFMCLLTLIFDYVYEYLTRKFVYSLLRVQKDKDDFLQTIEFLNISYFALKNSKIENPINMRKLSKHFLEEKTIDVDIIEKVFNHLLEIEKFDETVKFYLNNCIKEKNFSFNNFLSLLNKFSIDYFDTFRPVGTLHFIDKYSKEKNYAKFYLKINQACRNTNILNEEDNVFEFLLVDITKLVQYDYNDLISCSHEATSKAYSNICSDQDSVFERITKNNFKLPGLDDKIKESLWEKHSINSGYDSLVNGKESSYYFINSQPSEFHEESILICEKSKKRQSLLALPNIKRNIHEHTEDLKNNGKILNVLLVDDDELYLDILINQIKDFSRSTNKKIKYEKAKNCLEALNLIYSSIVNKQHKYNLIFIDENMPFILGSDFVKYYKDILIKSNFYDVSFVSISSELIRENYEKYYYLFLQKPYNKFELKNILESFCEY